MTNDPTIDGVSRELLEISAHCLTNSGYGVAFEELRALLDAPAVERHVVPEPIGYVDQWEIDRIAKEQASWATLWTTDGADNPSRRGSGSIALFTESPEVAALQSTIAQLQARIGGLESLHGEVYQVLGALDASAVVLDKVSAAANGESIPNTALLPYFPKGIQLPDKRQAMRSGDYICGWNAAIDATAELNAPKPAEWHDVAGDDEGLVS